MEDIDLIIGLHSIAEALKNPVRNCQEVLGTAEGLKELKKKLGGNIPCSFEQLNSHQLQERAKTVYADLGFSFQRIPSGVFLLAGSLPHNDVTFIYDEMAQKKDFKIFCLDNVTDVNNGGAILRTAAFYGVDCLLVSVKGNFGRSPSFARIASGALEHVPIVQCASLSKFLGKLKRMEVRLIGFSEHATAEAKDLQTEGPLCLVMGAEDVGLSNAVERAIDDRVAFKPQGKIQSLNVSVASAIAMEMFFS
jgi:23S rRNA (guanosine2251-2'-O)-methyltransferase